MGILADIFVATEDEALAYESAIGTEDIEQYERAEFKGLTDLEFGILWAILEKEEWSAEKHLLEEIDFNDESMLVQFSDELIALINAIDEQNIEVILDEWLEVEELSDWQREDLRLVLNDLIRLSKSTVSTKRGLYMWSSL